MQAFRCHENTVDGIHKHTNVLFLSLKDRFSGNVAGIDKLIVSGGLINESRRKQRLAPIVDCIKTLGRLGLPFRGQNDSSTNYPDVGKVSGKKNWKFY